MKKLFYSLFFILGFLCFLGGVKHTYASKCIINEVAYDLPKTIGIVQNYSVSKIGDDTPYLPKSFSSGITMIIIENQDACESISNYKYYLSQKYYHQLDRTTYTYYNILLDTQDGTSWSYSKSYPKFILNESSYNVEYLKIDETIETTYFANVGTLTSIETLKSYVTSIDDNDGDLSNAIELTEDNYTSHYNTLGNYVVKFSVTDSSNNVNEVIINVEVIDAFAPSIAGPATITSNMSSPLSIEQIKSKLSVKDNYDKTSTLEVETDTYSGNEQFKGSYYIAFYSLDSSNNKAIYKVNINTIDDIAPRIEGIKAIIKGNTSLLSKEEILSYLKASDNIDGDLTNSIIVKDDSYSLNSNIIGNYQLVYTVVDSSSNYSEDYIINISVYDSVPPLFNVDENTIITDTSTIVTNEQIINLFIKTNQIKAEDVIKLTLIEDTYTLSYDKDGNYVVTYSYETDDGVKQLSVKIEVTEKRNQKKSNKVAFIAISGVTTLLLALIFIFKKLIFVNN